MVLFVVEEAGDTGTTPTVIEVRFETTTFVLEASHGFVLLCRLRHCDRDCGD